MTLDVEHDIPILSGKTMKTTRIADAMEDDGHVDCDCGTMVIRHSWRNPYPQLKGFLQVDDSTILCEGGCNKWRHIWSELSCRLYVLVVLTHDLPLISAGAWGEF